MRNIQEDYFKYSNWRRRNFIVLLIFPINFVSNGKIKLYKSCLNGNTKLWKIKYIWYLGWVSLADSVQVGENVTQQLWVQVINVNVCRTRVWCATCLLIHVYCFSFDISVGFESDISLSTLNTDQTRVLSWAVLHVYHFQNIVFLLFCNSELKQVVV